MTEQEPHDPEPERKPGRPKEKGYDEKSFEIRNAWRFMTHISTLPRWTRVQNIAIEHARANLKGADVDTLNWILRELLLTLRCHQCERKLTDKCNFSICIRGLMSGVV